MSADLDRYFNALRIDSDTPVLANAEDIAHAGYRRRRTNRIAGAGVACVAVAGLVATVSGLAPHAAGDAAPLATAGGHPTPASTPAATPATPTTPATPGASAVATPAHTPTPSRSGSPAGGGPVASHTQPAALRYCRVADFGTVTAHSDSATSHDIFVVTFQRVGSSKCRLSPRPTVWLTDPTTGHDIKLPDANPFNAPHATKPVTVGPRSSVSIAVNNVDGHVYPTPPPSCAEPVTYQTLKVQLAGGVLVAHGLDMFFPCSGPSAGDWSLN